MYNYNMTMWPAIQRRNPTMLAYTLYAKYSKFATGKFCHLFHGQLFFRCLTSMEAQVICVCVMSDKYGSLNDSCLCDVCLGF